MQPQEYNLILKRLNRFERRARWHWVERAITLSLVAQLLVSEPAGVLKSQTARLRVAEARGRTAFAEGLGAARRALLVRPALDPRTVLDDEREAAIDALPMLPAANLAAQSPQATREAATPSRLHRQRALLAERPPILSQTSSSPAVAGEVSEAAPSPVAENALTWSSSVSAAERQMARAADNNDDYVAALMDSPVAGGALGLGGVEPAYPLPQQLAAPERLWRAVRASNSHRNLAITRDPFSFAGPLAAQTQRPSHPLATPAPPGSQSEPLPPGSSPALSAEPAAQAPAAQEATVPALPAVTLKALGYAESADGTAQAVLTDGNTLYVVKEGEDFAERFRVIGIRPEYLEVEDEYTNQTFRLPLGD